MKNPDCPRPEPLSPLSEPWIHQIKEWLNYCLERHGSVCAETLSGLIIDESTPPVLPSRVIDVGLPDGSVAPRLLQANGATGYYTALSYCWGASEKTHRSYLTTVDTLEKHLSSIPWDLLPKTLRDAVLLTRAVGIRYLWVDSLCIIQDSTDDWEQESAKMGVVYSHARFVIAATIGEDANTGLFPPQEHVYHPGPRPLCFSREPKAWGLGRGALPLFARGWTAQEWILSRRIVFWTHERMCWRCRCRSVREDDWGLPYESGLIHGEYTWTEVVEDYSQRNLTYQSDKLFALQGLVSQLSKRRPDDRYAMGTWLSNMPQELLWSANQSDIPTGCGPHRLDFPSWSWVSHPGGVSFMSCQGDIRLYDCLERSRYLSFSLANDFSVLMKTRSKKVDLDGPDTAEYMAKWHRNGPWSVEVRGSHMRREVFDSSCPDLAQTDEAVISLFGANGKRIKERQITACRKELSILFDTQNYLSRYRREKDGPAEPGATPDFLFVEVMLVKVFERPIERHEDRRTDGAQRSKSEVGRIAGLLLRKIDGSPGRFTRVGVATAPRDWLQDAEVGEVVVE